MFGPLTLLLVARPQAVRPTLRFENPSVQQAMGPGFDSALDNLLRINTVAADLKQYNRTGLMKGARFIRAGGEYDQPWTRDAAINGWNAASLLEPEIARDTFWAVTAPDKADKPIVQRDNQWWDKVVWIVGAWNHYRTTGDRAFLTESYGVAGRLLREMRATRYDARWGLFQGPSFFNDGIAGYPAPPAEPNDGGSSFVLDHPGTEKLMPLSTNCLYVGAYRAASAMAKELGQPTREWDQAADALRANVDRRFWMPKEGRYGYLLMPTGEMDRSQETSGLAFAILFGVASPARAKAILKNTHREPFGAVDVWPHFPRFSDDRPGRHNGIVWPMVQGMWSRAAVQMRDAKAFETEAESLATLVRGSEGRFFEIYNARTGKVDGGWQNGHTWGSVPDQTWSATAYLNMVTNGLFGMRFEPKGLRFQPLVPKAWGDVALNGLPYRNAVLDIALRGTGDRIRTIRLDGKPLKGGRVPGDLVGKHAIEVVMR